MIVDGFTFFNEFDLLKLRLNELAGTVDLFVLVEAARTFSGQEKPLYFAERKEEFRDYPIAHVVVNDMPVVATAWAREYWQRNAIVRGLDLVPDDAVVMVSDVDEIPLPAAVPTSVAVAELQYFEQQFFYYDMHTRALGSWFGTRATRAGNVKRWTPQGIRDKGNVVVSPGGWHFTYTGGVQAIIRKIESFSHQEYNNPAVKNQQRIAAVINEGRDLFGRDQLMQFERVEGVAHLPRYVQEHVAEYVKAGLLKESRV